MAYSAFTSPPSLQRGTGSATVLPGLPTGGENEYLQNWERQVADTRIHGTTRKQVGKAVIATGVVTTVAGYNGYEGNTDGAGGVAQFNGPDGIVISGSDLYVADTNNHTIRKIQP